MRIFYIGGAGRSGSTIVELLLGNISGYFSVGEVRHFWEYWVENNRICGCGVQLNQCNFWQSVVEHLNLEDDKILYLATLARKIDRSRNLPRLMKELEANTTPVLDFISATENLYQAIHRVSGTEVIVDSSKTPAHFLLLHKLFGENIFVLHLIRDGRAVAYAWNKRNKIDPSIYHVQAYMPRRNLTLSLIRWLVENHYMVELGKTVTNYSIMKYENFVLDPFQELGNVLKKFEGSNDISAPFFYQKTDIEIRPTHSVGGNPVRFQNDRFHIVDEQEWKSKMNVFTRTWLGLLALSMLKRYGYDL